MPAIFDFESYAVEVEWLLTWYPMTSGANLSEPRIRGGTIRHKNTDPPFTVDNRAVALLGQAGTGTGDGLAPNNAVRAFVDVGVDPLSRVFRVELTAHIGNAAPRAKSFVLPPNSRVPFLINVVGRADDDIVRDTGAAFQGVVTTGHRAGLADVVSRLFGP